LSVRPYVVRPAAAEDIRRAYKWYERARKGLGEELLVEIRAAIDQVLRSPLAYPVLHRETRRVLVQRFPYGLFYRIVDDIVVFVACTHTRRDAKAWQRRR
jgi:plasmid stabilization system protein ParE